MMCDTRVDEKETKSQFDEGRKGKMTARLTRFDESLVVPVLILLLEERISVELDHLIGDPTFAEGLADSFGDEDDDLEEWSRVSSSSRGTREKTSTHHRRKNVSESSSELEHDDYDRHCHPSHTTEELRREARSIRTLETKDKEREETVSPKRGGSSKESVCSRRDTRNVGLTGSEPSRLRIRTVEREEDQTKSVRRRGRGRKKDERVHRLRDDPNHSSKSRSDSHRGNKDTSRDLTSIRDDNESSPNDSGEEESVDVRPLSEGPEEESTRRTESQLSNSV